MAEIWYGHFDSTPDDERLLLAADWARFIASFITSGIRNGGTCLQVTEDSGMSVKVDNGMACILGYIVELKTDLDGRFYKVAIPPAHPQYPRIDRIILRLDRRIQSRKITPLVLMGVAAQNPVATALTRDNDIYDLSLAKIRVNSNVTSILSENITDERFITDLCGVMNSVLGLDPSVWQQQFDTFYRNMDAYLSAKKTEWDGIFNTQKNDWVIRFDDFLQTQINRGYVAQEEFNKYIYTSFNNWGYSKECKKRTEFNTDGFDIYEKIIKVSNSSLIAEKKTKFNPNGSIAETITVFPAAGVSSIYSFTVTTSFDESGIDEVVT